ncbi:nucleotide disphospho-sugar-binding domain-containing protein [Allokutzneria albata]|uniref:Glycosyltransferase, MGT family n=1 Tax=Allokutzneria albata TaxID=211114 RepID=A0A1G9VH79_ALLAB|nr:nucleotide disphospho-sugar-binding domain-containing protein [Allokutzneria albata]SDM71499.1 glycosyltransferase, MGT family [Allokutzneria albata]
MADFLFVPYSSHGHVNPLLPVLRELVAGGDRASVIVAPNFAEAVAATGARVLRLPTTSHVVVPERFDPVDEYQRLVKALADRRAIWALLRGELRHQRPDLVVYDPMIPKVFDIACGHGVPTALFSTTYAQNEHVIALTVSRHLGTAVGDLLRTPLARRLHPWAVETARDHRVVLINALPELQPAADTFGRRVRFVGPLTAATAERCDDLPWPEIERRRVLLVSPGTVFTRGPGFFRTVVEAFADSEWLVLLATGPTAPESLGPLPPNVIARRSVPQTAVLEHAELFLTHAGMNSTLEALAAGVPMILVPRILDQRANARRVAELGAGVRIDAKLLHPQLLRLVAQRLTTDPAVRTAVDALRARITAQNGPAVAAGALREAADASCRFDHTSR